MEIVIVVGIIALLVWLIARRGQEIPPSMDLSAELRKQREQDEIARRRQVIPAPRDLSPNPVATQTSTIAPARNTEEYAPRVATADECWISPGHEVTFGGYNIPGGMLDVGTGLAAVIG